jgi:hypothetical protein
VLTATGRIAQHVALAALFFAAQARAADLGTLDDADVRLDTTVRETFEFRLEPASAALIAPINADDGDRSFAPGLISARTDITSELTAQHGNFGLDISADGWYDPIYFQPSADNSPYTYNAYQLPSNEFPAGTRHLMGAYAELGNAFVQDRFDIDDLPISVRLGRQTLLWGESLFFAANSIAAGQAPVDAIKSLGAPLATARELFLPVAQISTRIELSSTLSLEAYDQFEWRRDRLPAVASYFSTTDILDAGGESVILPDQYYLYRTADQTPHGIGQFGLALRSRSDALDLGLYALQYDAKLPVPIYNEAQSIYDITFPRRIQLIGASFSSYAGDSNIAGEISLRHNMPLLAGGSFAGGAAFSGGGGVYDAPELPAAPPPTPAATGYATGNVWLAQTSLVSQLPPTRWWQTATMQTEIAANDLIGVSAGHAFVIQGQTHFAAALRTVFTPQYYQVLPGLDISFPTGLGYTPVGRSSIDATMYQSAGDLTLSATATYRQVWQSAISYTHFLGGPTAQRLADRDFLSVSISRTF